MSNLSEKFEQKIAENQNGIIEAEIVAPVQAPAQNFEAPVVRVMEVEVPAENLEVIRKRHENSREKYPEVKIDEDEYVVMRIGRHDIGIFEILLSSLPLFIILTSAAILLSTINPLPFEIPSAMKGNLILMIWMINFLLIVLNYARYAAYKMNFLTITNERAIQQISTGLFHKAEQVINLESTEDISYVQNGILQHTFNYGTVRLSTTGDESTYTFVLAKNPAKLVEIISEIAECARENQPISEKVFEEAQKMSR